MAFFENGGRFQDSCNKVLSLVQIRIFRWRLSPVRSGLWASAANEETLLLVDFIVSKPPLPFGSLDMSPKMGCVNIRAFSSTKLATSLTVTSLSCLSVMVSATSRHFWRRLKGSLDTIFFKLSEFSILLR